MFSRNFPRDHHGICLMNIITNHMRGIKKMLTFTCILIGLPNVIEKNIGNDEKLGISLKYIYLHMQIFFSHYSGC